MPMPGIVRATLAGTLLLAGTLAALPAQAETVGPLSQWIHREDATAPGADVTSSVAAPDATFRLYSFSGQVGVSGVPSAAGPVFGANFVPPTGQTLEAGATYFVDGGTDDPTPTRGRLRLWRDGTMCGQSWDELDKIAYEYQRVAPAIGWFHVSEIGYDDVGRVNRFAATYEMNCQYADGPLGFEGSVAVDASEAPPVPDAPSAPGPVTSLRAVNIGPDGAGTNSTTLSWQNPAGFGDVTVDMVQSSNRAKLPARVGRAQWYRGTGSSRYDNRVEFMDTRTYRVVARGPSGRLGTPSYLTVLGSRLTLPDPQIISVGQVVRFSGRLTEAWDWWDVPGGEIMNGPALAGRLILLCEQSSVNYVDGECTPVDRAITSADGRFAFSANPMANHLYNVVVPATPTLVGNAMRVVEVKVAPRTDLKAPLPQADGARTAAVRRGSVINFTTLRARRGSRGFVRLQRFDGHRWVTVVTKRLGTGSRRMAIPYREKVRGRHAYRIVKPGDARHVNGRSRIVYIQVR